jgi:serine/threonine-protein kinase
MSTGDDDPTQRAQGRLGTVLRGKYRLDRVLGTGGMAVVYKATHRNEAEFALKMLHPELSMRDDVRTRFLREGRAANSVKHPGVVAVVDDDVAEDGAAFLVMELLSGEVVESLWERNGSRLPPRTVLGIGDQLLDVLAAAHEKGIVHRDIKPPNLFLTKDGTLKVLDFGIARVKDVTAGLGSGQQTGTGMLLGTPAFMAPEQAYAKASEIDGQTDVWAVGATLFSLLTGQPVHEGENAAQLMIHAATTRARPVTSLAPDIPPAMAEVIDRALAFEKSGRWPSASAMQDALVRASLATYGERIAKAELAQVVAGEVLGTAATQLGQMNAPTGGPAQPLGPARAAATPPQLIVARTLPAGVGTTAQPVFSEPLPSLPGAARPTRAPVLSIVALALIIVVGVVVKTVVAPATGTPTASVGLVAPPAPSASPAPASSASPAPAVPAAPAIPATVETVTAAPATKSPTSVHRSTPTPQLRQASAPSPAVGPAVPSPAAASTCDPPYFYDSTGGKHYKPDCFGH